MEGKDVLGIITFFGMLIYLINKIKNYVVKIQTDNQDRERETKALLEVVKKQNKMLEEMLDKIKVK